MKKFLNIGYWAILVFYVLLLVDIVFMARDSLRSVNFIPFHSIKDYIMVDNGLGEIRLLDVNIWGNILMFIPAGIYVTLHNAKKTISHNLLFIVVISLFIEIVQFIFTLGATDIDDIILNMFGGLIGIVIFKALNKWLKDEYKVKRTITVLSLVIGLPIVALTVLLIIVN
ncbi:glycopeptide antibiotics resistance protein [Fontibacillus solani]|uniref:Glycopeptide antibiotics resistance protein n=1 Tax=Fontibacillus solani TaxID=1572857 RepID=A0A7W3SP92_9BACL|nr:VanZ family protein [Fontibacillus solani]MBA9083710.1 glycopeptide antibiotics resistance protein [Fontibacillus solani]